MAEYIDREALMRQIKEIHCADCNSYHGVRCRACWVDDTLGYIESEPSADVAQVRHGRWESVKNPQWPAYSHDKCSLCGWWNTKNALCYDGRKKPGHALKYCPNCGAKMDGDSNV